MQIAVPKGRGVFGSFYKNMALKKLRTKMSTERPKNSLQHVHLLHDNAPAHKSSTVAQVLKSEKITVLPHPPYSLDTAPCIFPLSKIGKKKLEMYQYDTDAPAQGPSLPVNKHFAKTNEVKMGILKSHNKWWIFP